MAGARSSCLCRLVEAATLSRFPDPANEAVYDGEYRRANAQHSDEESRHLTIPSAIFTISIDPWCEFVGGGASGDGPAAARLMAPNRHAADMAGRRVGGEGRQAIFDSAMSCATRQRSTGQCSTTILRNPHR